MLEINRFKMIHTAERIIIIFTHCRDIVECGIEGHSTNSQYTESNREYAVRVVIKLALEYVIHAFFCSGAGQSEDEP